MSNNTPPTRIRFLLCDDLRAEMDGKLTIVGLYPDDKMIVNTMLGMPVPTGVGAFAVPQLAIVSVVLDGSGTFPARAEIRGPGGSVVNQMGLGSAVLVAGKTATIVVKGGPFPVMQFGQYKFTLTLGNNDFPFDFEIIAGSGIGGATAVSPPIKAAKRARKKRKKKKA